MKHESKVGEGGKSEGGLIEVWIQQRGDQLKGVKVDYLSTRPIYKDQIVVHKLVKEGSCLGHLS